MTTDPNLPRYVWNDIVDRWQFGERAIESSDVYTRLVHFGVEIPNHAMSAMIAKWQAAQLLQGVQVADADAVRIHGSTTITWVDTTNM